MSRRERIASDASSMVLKNTFSFDSSLNLCFTNYPVKISVMNCNITLNSNVGCWKLCIIFYLSVFSYLNAIQTMCPHILRYLATAVIINKSRRNSLKDLVKVIQQVKKSSFL